MFIASFRQSRSTRMYGVTPFGWRGPGVDASKAGHIPKDAARFNAYVLCHTFSSGLRVGTAPKLFFCTGPRTSATGPADIDYCYLECHSVSGTL
jgi:hypothetical protein